MSLIGIFLDFVLHLDKHLNSVVQTYGTYTLLILFCIIFAETGLVITPFLPGDSLLFAAGAIAAQGPLNIYHLFILLIIAAVIGDTINYSIGNYLGHKVFKKEKSRFFKKEYLDRTEKFYEKHGKKTIILARFVPIIRTFAPFVAGIGKMNYLEFIAYNVIGGITWVALFVFGGYFFGNIPIIKNNFSIVILAIIILSIMPMVIEIIKHKKNN